MLVLTRRPGESIIIAGDIKITVVNVGPGRVKLGIEAPPHVRVDRQEVHEKIEQASDVLVAVGGGADVSGESHHTTINSGADTATIVTSPPSTPAVAEPAAPALAVNKLSKYRLPRKPR